MVIFIFLSILLLINIAIYYEINKLNKFQNYDKIQAKKICAWVESVCDTENIESNVDDKNVNVKFWGILIANNSKSMIYDVKITVEETQNDRIINIHRNINILPPGSFYCKRLYSPSKLPFDLPKRLTTFKELVDTNCELKAIRPMTIGKKKVIKLEFRDSNNNFWERNEFGILKKIN